LNNSINSLGQTQIIPQNMNLNRFSINNINPQIFINSNIQNSEVIPNNNPNNFEQVSFGENNETNNNSTFNLNISLPIYDHYPPEQSQIERPPSIPLTLYANDTPTSLFLEDIDNNDSIWCIPNEEKYSECMNSFQLFPN